MASNIQKINTLSTRFFGWVATNVDKARGYKKITPVDEDGKKLELPNRIQQLYDQFIAKNTVDPEKLRERFYRYKEIDGMTYGFSDIKKALNITADESVQSDENQIAITVTAKRKLKKEIEDFWEKIDIYNKIRSTILNIATYGDAGWILSYEKDFSGIKKVRPVDPYDITERIEFIPNKVDQEIRKNGSFLNQLYHTTSGKIKDLINSIKEDEDYSQAFEHRLFGFVIGNFAMPPWRFIHFRRDGEDNPFSPYGYPSYIHLLGPWKQVDTAWSLQILARGSSFPIDKLVINIPNVTDPETKFQKALEYARKYQNMGKGRTYKENSAVGETKIEVGDFITWEKIDPGIKFADIDDIELLEEKIYRGLYVPRGYFDATASAFGSSGVQLMQQFKPFAREVRANQEAFMEGVKLLTDIHLVLKGWSEEDMDYQISMPYPESQVDRDNIGSQNDLLRLANDILDAIRDKIGGSMGDALPIDLVRMVYKKVLPYDDETIEKWIKQFDKDKEDVNIRYIDGGDGADFDTDKDISQMEPEFDNEFEANTTTDENQEVVEESIREVTNLNKRMVEVYRVTRRNKDGKITESKVIKRLTEAQLLDIYDEATIFGFQKNNPRSRLIGNRVFFSSKVRHPDYDPTFIVKSGKKRLTEQKEFAKMDFGEDLDFVEPQKRALVESKQDSKQNYY